MKDEKMIEKLNYLNSCIKSILEIAFERNNYQLTEKDKMAIKSFRENIFLKSVENIEDLGEFQEMLNIISKIRRFSIKGRIEDTKFVEKIFPKDFILDNLESHIEQVYMSKEKLNMEEIKSLDAILVCLINEDSKVTNIIKKSIELMEKSGVDISNTNFIQIFIKRFTEKYSMVIVDESSKEEFELAYKFLDLSTKKRDFNLFNNQGVSDLLQISKSIPDKNREEIIKIINQNMNLDKVDISELNGIVKRFVNENLDGICTNEEEFEEFLENIQILKLSQIARMDLEVIKLILKQFLSDKSIVASNKRKYFGLLQRTLEDLSAKDSEGTTFFRSEFSQKMSAGQTFPRTGVMILDTKSAENLLEDKDLFVLETIYHENTHIIQYDDMREISRLQNNSLRILQLEEEIIKKYNSEYYIANYSLMFQEIEARERGAVKLLTLINELKISGFDSLKEKLKERIMQEQSNYIAGRVKRKSINSDEVIDIKKYMKELIKFHPEILEEYPILLGEYEKQI